MKNPFLEEDTDAPEPAPPNDKLADWLDPKPKPAPDPTPADKEPS